MITAFRTIGFRSRAQSLVRFAEALKRAKTASGVVSLVRAHTPHTPRGRALTRRPGSLVRARSSAQASERSRTGVVGPCDGETRVACWANAVARTRHGGTWAARLGRGRESAGRDGRPRYFPGGMASRRRREQPQSPTEFVSLVRSDPHTRARLATSGPTLARVAPGGAPPNHPAIPPPGPARANVARWSAGLLAPIHNPEARRFLP